MTHRLARTLLVCLAASAAAGPAAAAEYCVACTGPDATYRCEVGTGSNADPRAWLICITELAKEGGHDSCSVDRKAPVPCPGVHRVLAAPEGPTPPAAPPVQIAVPDPGKSPPPAPAPMSAPAAASPPDGPEAPPADAGLGEPAPKRVPRTMEELAKDTYEQSKEGVKKASEAVSNTAQKAGDAVTGTAQKAGEKISNAGSAIGDAAKKTWNCVTSLFQSCE